VFGLTLDPLSVPKNQNSSAWNGIVFNPLHYIILSGLPFRCLLDIAPIRNEDGEVVLFLVSHKEIEVAEEEILKSPVIKC